jgi:hypothetical protein
MRWKQKIHKVAGKTAAASLGPLLHKNSRLSLKLKIHLYKSILKPLLSYASPVWLMAAKTHLNKIQRTENKLLRRIIGAPWYIRNKDIRKDLRITPILTDLKSHLATFQKSLASTKNRSLENLWDYEATDHDKHKTSKHALFPHHIPSP